MNYQQLATIYYNTEEYDSYFRKRKLIQVSSTCIVGNIQHLSFYKPAGYSKKSKKRERKEKKDMGPFKTLEKLKNTDKH